MPVSFCRFPVHVRPPKTSLVLAPSLSHPCNARPRGSNKRYLSRESNASQRLMNPNSTIAYIIRDAILHSRLLPHCWLRRKRIDTIPLLEGARRGFHSSVTRADEKTSLYKTIIRQ